MSESEGFEMGSSFDRIQSALDELERECCMEAPWYHRLMCEMARVPEVFKIDLGTESPRSLRLIIQRSKRDWRFLRMFVDFSVKWGDAEDLGQQSLVVKIDAAAHEMAEDLSYLEFFNLVLKWERKIEVFKVENHEAFVNYLSVCSVASFKCSLHCVIIHWAKFLNSVCDNLLSVTEFHGGDSPYSFHMELCLIQNYLNGLRRIFESGFAVDILIRVASVAVRAAVRSFNSWFIQRDSMEAEDRRIIGFRDSEHEIDPADPGFMELHLKFLRAINKFCLINYLPGMRIEWQFVDYLLEWIKREPFSDLGRHSSSYGFHWELVFLLSFVVNPKLEDSREDVQSFMWGIVGNG